MQGHIGREAYPKGCKTGTRRRIAWVRTRTWCVAGCRDRHAVTEKVVSEGGLKSGHGHGHGQLVGCGGCSGRPLRAPPRRGDTCHANMGMQASALDPVLRDDRWSTAEEGRQD